MNARGQGHLLTFAKVTWELKNILSIFSKKKNKKKNTSHKKKQG